MEGSESEAPAADVARRVGAAATQPEELRVNEIEVAGVELVVVSYPAEPSELCADSPLTRSEAEVAAMAIGGMSNTEIGTARGTSGRTVANQMASILRKLGVASRRELAVAFVRGTLDRRGAPAPQGPAR